MSGLFRRDIPMCANVHVIGSFRGDEDYWRGACASALRARTSPLPITEMPCHTKDLDRVRQLRALNSSEVQMTAQTDANDATDS
jgi:hypothetical protein